MFENIGSKIAYEVITKNLPVGPNSQSATIGASFFVVIVSLVALAFFFMILYFLYKSTKSSNHEETESLFSDHEEDPEKDIVSNAFSK